MSVSDASTALPAAVPAPRLSEAQVALALSLLLGLQPLTTDLYLPALPLLRHALDAGMAAAQLTMSALLLSFGLAQLLMGPLSDRFGRRPVLLGGLGLHALAGVGVALAPDMATLILAARGAKRGHGRTMNGQLAPLAVGLALASLAVIGVAFTLVRWHGEPKRAAAR